MLNHIQHTHSWDESSLTQALAGCGFEVDRLSAFATARLSAWGDLLHLVRIIGIGGSRYSRIPRQSLSSRPMLSLTRRLAIRWQMRIIRAEEARLVHLDQTAGRTGVLLIAASKPQPS